MSLTGVSYNAGVVKYFFSTLLHPLRDERHFALVEIKCHTNQGSLVISSGQNSVRPMHLFGHNLDHDYYFVVT